MAASSDGPPPPGEVGGVTALRHRPRDDGQWWASNSRCYTLTQCAACREPIPRLQPRLRNSGHPNAKAWHFQCAMQAHPLG
eukprot:500399-Alexandrium_andersonii.AAC.1